MTLRAGALANLTRNLRNNIPVVAMSDGKEYPLYMATMVTPAEGEEGGPRLVLSLEAPEETAAPEGEGEGDSDGDGQVLRGADGQPLEGVGGNAPGYGNNLG